ncbi:MAG TPA: MoaD family protein [Candidatus Limnocylindria bacterium]|nr:MoaD family protein [Candidatus Limnocylindria bacterium]
MSIKVRIPLTLRRLTSEQEVIEIKAATVAEAVDAMHARYNGIRERIVDKTGHIRGSVLVFVNEEDIRFLQNEQTPLKDGDEISIVPAFAGG